jgi:hypothetical protein
MTFSTINSSDFIACNPDFCVRTENCRARRDDTEKMRVTITAQVHPSCRTDGTPRSEQQMSIGWFPGHMASARKKAAETLAKIDVDLTINFNSGFLLGKEVTEAKVLAKMGDLRESRQWL